MRIGWILSRTNVARDERGVTSPLASYRYRALVPLRELEARGHVCSVFELTPGGGAADHPALRECDAVIFGKNHSEQADVVALLDHARERGVATIADMCDDYFGPGDKLAPYYAALAAKATLVTASTPALASCIEEATDANVCVVKDPYEGPAGAPRFAPALPKLKALWFGTPFNLASLLDEIVTLPGRVQGCELDLRVLTKECPGLVDAFAQMNARNGGKLVLTFEEWSLARNWSALEASDLALITVDGKRRFFQVKGSNRLMECLRAGRFAVVQPMPAYKEFEKWAWVGEDIAAGLAWAAAHPAEVKEKIAAGQAYIESHYSPAAIAADWESACGEAIDARRAQ